MRPRRIIKQKNKKMDSLMFPLSAAADCYCSLSLSPNHLRRHTTHPNENSAVPFAGCSTPNGHRSLPGHFGSSEIAILFRYVPCSCFLWHASQKCVDPQQYHELTEQQNLHLYVMYFLPCFLHDFALGPLAHEPHTKCSCL